MLGWFRIHAPRIAFSALLSFAAVGTSAVSPHEDDCHDAACRAMAVEHDASAHQIGAPAADSDIHPLHCLVCHWARSFRPPITSKFVVAPVVHVGFRVHLEPGTVARNAQIAQPSPRSPPSSPVA